MDDFYDFLKKTFDPKSKFGDLKKSTILSVKPNLDKISNTVYELIVESENRITLFLTNQTKLWTNYLDLPPCIFHPNNNLHHNLDIPRLSIPLPQIHVHTLNILLLS